jgi:hypothetical protein
LAKILWFLNFRQYQIVAPNTVDQVTTAVASSQAERLLNSQVVSPALKSISLSRGLTREFQIIVAIGQSLSASNVLSVSPKQRWQLGFSAKCQRTQASFVNKPF